MKEGGAIIIAVVFLLLLASCCVSFRERETNLFGLQKADKRCKKRQLNENNSAFIMFGNKMPGNDLIESSGPMSNNSYVKNLEVFFDSDRQFNSGVKNVLCFS